MKAFLSFAFAFLIPSMAISDSIVLKDGSVYSGKILGATESIVKIETRKNIENLPASEVLSLVFANADVVNLTKGQSIECKIISKTGDMITIMTTDGEQTVDNKEIKNVQYNTGYELKVSFLPVTDRHFKNNPNPMIRAGEKQKSVYVGAYIGSQFSSLDAWQKQFIPQNGKRPPTNGLQLGGEIGIINNKNFEIGAGFEYFFIPVVKLNSAQSNAKDKVSSFLYYGALKICHNLNKLPNMRIYAGLDLGLVNGIEKIQGLGGMDFEASSTTFAKRIKIGSSYFYRNSSYYFDIGYLAAKVTDLEILGKEIPDYNLDFSGLFIVSGYRYHFPF
jgi:hypothetical protein